MNAAAIQVWSVPLALPPARIAALWETLSADERARAMAFRFEADRGRFVAARGLLRALLGQILSHSPGRLRFRYGSRGKPALCGPCGAGRLRFNLSHGAGLMAVAVTEGREIGIDLEAPRPGPVWDALAGAALSRREAAALAGAAEGQAVAGKRAAEGERAAEGRAVALRRLWTRKEAVMKALGHGAALAPDRVEVSGAGEPAAVLAIAGSRAAAARWRLADLALGPGFVGTLAAEAGDWRVVPRRWPPAR